MEELQCLRPKDVQQILGLSKTETYRLFKSKDFPSFTLGEKLLRVTKRDFEEWFNKKKSQTAQNS
ncbi:helix-turn-helix domain-containing protein [Cellulosilyticum sp. WCF-2]|uniref:helix-turn-helix domain-containing protein n=1 Tax=Cellulosilyticum sp. WCF-2 TaxID=2497860 RepID=UPI000F8C47B5|nr:helix-turn-helix domain-containing protein [Cellulosilyticum sp. WCF-2]QEH69757.1 helix-turn-helix domain-containing protein [Cellulosilyticum sp. WCF-2]